MLCYNGMAEDGMIKRWDSFGDTGPPAADSIYEKLMQDLAAGQGE